MKRNAQNLGRSYRGRLWRGAKHFMFEKIALQKFIRRTGISGHAMVMPNTKHIIDKNDERESGYLRVTLSHFGAGSKDGINPSSETDIDLVFPVIIEQESPF